MSERSILLEICTASLDDAVAAEAGGAGRIELNSSLLQGGLTPSLGTLIEVKRRLAIPVMSMVRPRGGGFCYTEHELAVMERDAELFAAHGADGIVFGVLADDGTVDLARNRRLLARLGTAQPVFHRAFDVTPDPFRALEELIDLGVARVMTSGQEDNVYNGCVLIRQLIERAAGRIDILPGGGITRFNLRDVLARTGADQVHMPVMRPCDDRSTAARAHVYFGGALRPAEDRYETIDRAGVAAIRGLLDG